MTPALRQRAAEREQSKREERERLQAQFRDAVAALGWDADETARYLLGDSRQGRLQVRAWLAGEKAAPAWALRHLHFEQESRGIISSMDDDDL